MYSTMKTKDTEVLRR